MLPLAQAVIPIIEIGIGIRHMVAAANLATGLKVEMAPRTADHLRRDVHTVVHPVT
jgi:hypothetical protein